MCSEVGVTVRLWWLDNDLENCGRVLESRIVGGSVILDEATGRVGALAGKALYWGELYAKPSGELVWNWMFRNVVYP